jgi:1-acyl-sn-glycerol-3-phosphate acyltransferase
MLLENWPKPIRSLLFRVLGVHWAHRFLSALTIDSPPKLELLERIFQRNNFDVQASGEEKIPEGGGCIFASNHPHGLFDGLGGIWLGCRNGHDSRAIGRHFLSVFEPIRDWFLLVKVDANRKAKAGQQVMEQSVRFLNAGGSLVITPAGRVGVSRPLWTPAQDMPWRSGAVRLAHAAGAPIVLVYIEVRPSLTRQLAQSIHGVVRALIQVWAFRLGRTQKLHMHVLDVVQPDQLPNGSSQAQTAWLQARFNQLVEEQGLIPAD